MHTCMCVLEVEGDGTSTGHGGETCPAASQDEHEDLSETWKHSPKNVRSATGLNYFLHRRKLHFTRNRAQPMPRSCCGHARVRPGAQGSYDVAKVTALR